jgi:hypothetical protein
VMDAAPIEMWRELTVRLSPRGRGREAMTYGRALLPNDDQSRDGATVSHSAELVGGDFLSPCAKERPPHPALRATFSPRGEGTLGRSLEKSIWLDARSIVREKY